MDNQIETIAQAAAQWVRDQKLTPLRIEQTLVNDGVCGTCDLVAEDEHGDLVVVDWKTTNKAAEDLPTEAWDEHREQIGFYCAAACLLLERNQARTFIVYLSTKEPGAIKPCEVTDWRSAEKSFRALFNHWCYRNDYDPRLRNGTLDEQLKAQGW